MRKNRSDDIALELRKRLSAPGPSIPSVRALAREFKAGKTTVWKALRSCGHRAIPKRRDNAGSSGPPNDAVRTLYQKIKDNLQDGIYRSGELLPKSGTLTLTHHLSHTTVCRALRRLSDDHLVHKRGKRWVAGPAPAVPSYPAAVPSNGLEPMVLILCTDPYQNVFSNTFLQPFCQSLDLELREKGVQARVGHRIKEAERSPIPLQGMDEIRKHVRAWGDFYRGAVILDQHMDAETMREWAGFLSCSGSRPVVFFDAANDRRSYNRSELSLGKFYYRLHMDERAAVSLALRHVNGFGHRLIGVPHWSFRFGVWVERRVALIEKLAKSLIPKPAVFSGVLTEPFWDPYGSPNARSTAKFYRAIIDHTNSQVSTASRRLLRPASSHDDVRRHTPSLAALLDRNVTAIIALNDFCAQQLCIWCSAAGIDIPGDLSVISFDNEPNTRMFPISTIDFGFSRLGYCAARTLCGAAVADADRDGNIPGICAIVNRGSVAQATG